MKNAYANSELMKILNSVRADVFSSSVGDVLELALMFAGTFAAIKIIINVLPILMSPDKEFDKIKILQPVFLVILLIFYPSFINLTRGVMSTFESLTITGETLINEERFIVSLEEELFLPTINKIEKDWRDKKILAGESTTLGGELFDWVTGEGEEEWEIGDPVEEEDQTAENDSSLVVDGFKKLLVWMSSIIKSIVLHIRNAVLIVLEIGGPIAICLSLIPTLEGSLKKWFGIYLHLYLWFPICTIIDAVSLATFRAFQELYPDASLGNFIISAVFLVCYVLVPKITSYFIESKDQGLAMSAGINKAANLVMGKAMTLFKGNGGDTPSSLE